MKAEKLREQESATLDSLVQGRVAVVHPEHSLREAADLMIDTEQGRLPVVPAGAAGPVIGMISRSDLLAAHGPRLREQRHLAPRRRLVPRSS